jgi:hypothetical protein
LAVGYFETWKKSALRVAGVDAGHVDLHVYVECEAAVALANQIGLGGLPMPKRAGGGDQPVGAHELDLARGLAAVGVRRGGVGNQERDAEQANGRGRQKAMVAGENHEAPPRAVG